MKKTTTLIAFLFIAFAAFAQEKVNLVIFSEDLEPFYCYVNGIKQNANPETNVRITGVTPNIALRIEFSNKALPLIKQNMALEPNFEHTARLKYDKNKVMKLRYFGSVSLAEVSEDNTVPTVTYHTSDTPVSETKVNTSSSNVNTMPVNGSINITSSTVTTTKNNNAGIKGETMNINMPGINMNVTINDPFANTNMQTTTSTTVTTSSTSSSSDSRNHGSYSQQKSPAAPAPQPIVSKSGCTAPMSTSAFTTMKSNIESKPFSETRMSTARIATKNACLSVKQVKEITSLFNMDDDKLAYAKFAFDYCVDKANYYEVSEVFSFSSTTDDFNNFLDK
jgi:hypothetical protein